MRGQSLRSLLLAAAVLLVACASLAHGSQLHFSVSASQQAYLNTLHAPESLALKSAIEQHFRELDTNADGELSDEEMQEHEQSGMMSPFERTLLAAFDADNSGSLSAAEAMLAPHTLNMLEQAVDIDDYVPHGNRLAATRELASAEAAFEGAEEVPRRRLKSRVQAEDTSFAEIGSDGSDAPAADAAAGAAAGGDAGAAAGGAQRGKKARRGSAPLPVSLFGVPSVADEECVMCQYFVQRIQFEVADRLEKAPGAAAEPAAAGGEGLQGATKAAQKLLEVRKTNSQLQKKSGGRGIVRVVAEDVMSQLCSVDRMPLLFNPYCGSIGEPNTINAVRKAIFFNMPTVEVCSQAALCRDDSYVNTNAAVHASKTSLFLNSQRGVCGMLGGRKDRPNARDSLLINAICAAHGATFGTQE